jgi:hypothetical protein
MRVWDIPPEDLCNNHLLGEHRELHAVWSVITKNKEGYSNHPETKRWVGKLAALYARHEKEVAEMKNRGFNHFSPLEKELAKGKKEQDLLIDSKKRQRKNLKNKPCFCR